MTAQGCERLALADLTDYAAGELGETDAAGVEEHIFSCAGCAGRAAELDALVRAIREAVLSAAVGGVMTDAVLNRLARDGMRVRSYVLRPGAVVACAVWEDDELMVLRLRGDLGRTREVTVSHRIAGTEISRVTATVGDSANGEVIVTVPAASVRQLPVVDLEILLTAEEEGEERRIGSYTLVHGGALHR